MAIDIGGAKIEGSGVFKLKNTSNDIIYSRELSTYSGNLFAKNIQSKIPMFQAGTSTNPGWVGWTSSWRKMSVNFNNVSINNGNHYNTSSTRFNVPITGPYLFIYTSYIYSSSYLHPQFAVNGGVATRRPVNTPYRIRGHGMVANHQQDAQIEEVIYCIAGDYVEPYGYAGGTAYSYDAHALFCGIYVG